MTFRITPPLSGKKTAPVPPVNRCYICHTKVLGSVVCVRCFQATMALVP